MRYSYHHYIILQYLHSQKPKAASRMIELPQYTVSLSVNIALCQLMTSYRKYVHVKLFNMQNNRFETDHTPTIHVQSNLLMQSPVLKGHLFLVLSWKVSYELNLF